MGSYELSPGFQKVVEQYTRKEFNEKFKVSWGFLCGEYNSIGCPYTEACPVGDNCGECWDYAIENTEFKKDLSKTEAYKALTESCIGCRIFNEDPYLNQDNVFNRLRDEYNTHGSIIIAFDYDDTVFDFHSKGRTYNCVIEALRKWKDKARFICFTGNQPDKYVEIIKYLAKNDIPVDKINEGFDGLPNGTHKPYYNILLDDRAGLCDAYNVLNRLYFTIEKENN